MDFGTAPPVTAALHEAVDLGQLGYLPDRRPRGMSQAWAGCARDVYGWDVPPERVRPLADVVSGLVAAIEHFSRPGSAVILPTPAYMPFLVVPPALGREVVQVPMARRTAARSSTSTRSTRRTTRAPTCWSSATRTTRGGRVHERAELTALAEVVERHGGRVFSDEIHAPLVYDGHRHVPYATRLRGDRRPHGDRDVGVEGVEPPRHQVRPARAQQRRGRRHLGRGRPRTPSTAPPPWGWSPPSRPTTQGRPWLAEVVAYLDGNRRLLADLLAERIPEIGYTPPEGTYLAWLDCRALDLGDHPGRVLPEQAGVALTDGPACGVVGAGFARYTLATPRAILEQTVDQMAAALRRR